MADVIDTLEIVTIASLHEALNITITLDDGKLARLLEAARDFVEGYVGPLDDFDAADAVPDAIAQALRLYVGHLYEEDAAPVPEGVFALIGPYRKWEF